MKNTTLSVDKEKLAQIAKKHNLVFIVLFGSKARGERKNVESDVDIAVLVKKKPTYTLFDKIFSAISDVFPGENVDVRFLNDTDLAFRFQIVRDGVLLFGDKRQYQHYLLSIRRQYVDDGRKYLPMLHKLVYERLQVLEEKL